MRIGILGSGDVAKSLAAGFLSRDHEVMLGTRDPLKLESWRDAAGKHAHIGSFSDAADYGEMIVLATHGMATVDIVQGAGAHAFSGKVVMDATNPLLFDDTGPHLAIGFDDSLGERIQRAIPSAKVVKVYNTVGNAHMVDPQFPGGPPDMFIAGDEEAAKSTVSKIVRDFGWNVIDLGGIEQSRLLEPMCMVWVVHGLRSGSWNHAFKLLTK